MAALPPCVAAMGMDAFRYLMRKFFKAVTEVLIMKILCLFVMFGAEILEQKGPAVILTEIMQNLRLDGMLTLIAMIYERLGELITLTQYP